MWHLPLAREMLSPQGLVPPCPLVFTRMGHLSQPCATALALLSSTTLQTWIVHGSFTHSSVAL